MANPVYSLVIPVYNEEETLPELREQLCDLMERLGEPTEVILVDDGSRDQSYAMMEEMHRQDPRFKVIALSRNFGHQLAITAGIDFASGDAVITMDADLQDPPEVVLQMVERWREGYHIVDGIREDRANDTWFKRVTASLFYRLLQRLSDTEMPMHAGDFRLIDRKALQAFKALREDNRYVRGMISWIGFRRTGVAYARPKRFAGHTKYPLLKMTKLALDGILSFSDVPLRMVLLMGVIVSCVSFLGGLLSIILKLAGAYTVSGWTSTIVVVFFIGGVQLVVIGVMGEYVGRIYQSVKNRPLYIVRDLCGLAAEGIADRVVVSQAADAHQAQDTGPEP